MTTLDLTMITNGDSNNPCMIDAVSKGSESSTETLSVSTDASSVLLSAPVEDTPKPFFVMDWLEKIDEKDLELAQRMLKTPQRDPIKNKEKPEQPLSKKLLFAPKKSPPQMSFHKRSIDIGNGWNAKGLQKAKLGEWEDALACWENALEIRMQVLGEDHLDFANTCNNIGIALGKLNRIEEAISFLHRALDIRTARFGREHGEVAATLHNIGNVLQQGNDLESAINCFCECKKLQEKLLGPYHVQVARACIAMGHTYYKANAFEDAREAYADALSIFENSGLSRRDVEIHNTLADIQEVDRRLREGNL